MPTKENKLERARKEAAAKALMRLYSPYGAAPSPVRRVARGLYLIASVYLLIGLMFLTLIALTMPDVIFKYTNGISPIFDFSLGNRFVNWFFSIFTPTSLFYSLIFALLLYGLAKAYLKVSPSQTEREFKNSAITNDKKHTEEMKEILLSIRGLISDDNDDDIALKVRPFVKAISIFFVTYCVVGTAFFILAIFIAPESIQPASFESSNSPLLHLPWGVALVDFVLSHIDIKDIFNSLIGSAITTAIGWAYFSIRKKVQA